MGFCFFVTCHAWPDNLKPAFKKNVKRNYLSTHVLFSTKAPLHFNIVFFSNHSKKYFHWLGAHLLALAHIQIFRKLLLAALIRSQYFICDTSHKCRAAAKFQFTSTCQDHFQQQQHIRWGKVKPLNFWLMITYIALFSTLLSRFTVLACDSTWVTSSLFLALFEDPPKRWHGRCHMKLLLSLRKFHVPREMRVSTKSRPWRRKFSHCSCRDSNQWPFSHKSGALTTELSLIQFHSTDSILPIHKHCKSVTSLPVIQVLVHKGLWYCKNCQHLWQCILLFISSSNLFYWHSMLCGVF